MKKKKHGKSSNPNNEKMILLMKNHDIRICDSSIIDEAMSSGAVGYILLDVGVHSSEYVIIPEKQFVFGFEHARIQYTHYVDNIDASSGVIGTSVLSSRCITCNNVFDLYRVYHSMCKLEGVDIMIANSYDCARYETTHESRISDVIIDITINGATRHVDIEKESDSNEDERHSLHYVMNVISMIVFGYESLSPLISNDIIINKFTHTYSIKEMVLQTDSLRWLDGKNIDYRNGLRLIYMREFEAMHFIGHQEYHDLKNLSSTHGFIITYTKLTRDPIPEGINLDSSTIEGLNGEYVMLYSNLAVSLINVSDIVQLLKNMKYIYLCMLAYKQTTWSAQAQPEILIDIMYAINNKKTKNDPYRRYHHFSKTTADFEKYDDFYGMFLEQLREDEDYYYGG